MGGDSLHCCYREQVAFALYDRFLTPKLYKYASSVEWEKVPSRCRSNPKEAFYKHKYAPHDTAIHQVLRQSIAGSDDASQQLQEWKFDAVKALLEANPQALSTLDAFGRTPLHIACMHLSYPSSACSEGTSTCDPSIALHLAEMNPSAGAVLDTVDRRTPLHYLVARHDEIPIFLVQRLLKSTPDAISAKDVTNETPVDIVTRRRDEIRDADTILRIFETVLKGS